MKSVCVGCGAPLQRGQRICAYCGVDNGTMLKATQLDDLYVELHIAGKTRKFYISDVTLHSIAPPIAGRGPDGRRLTPKAIQKRKSRLLKYN